MHIYKSRFLIRGEVWYDNEPDQTPVDWIFYRQRPHPVPGARWKYFYTILLDLSHSPEELLREMSKTTSCNIKRARDRDKIICECLNPVRPAMLDSFEEIYEHFAAIKGLNPLDRPLLDELAKEGFLELSVAKDPEGKPLAYHAYYRDSSRSCLLHTITLYQRLSDSAARNAMGRANRYLTWCDVLRHQEQGLKVFDFGGWYPGKSNQELLDINRFKEGFGGKVVREYNCEQILSLKGWVVLTAAGVLNWVRCVSAKLRAGRGPRRLETVSESPALHEPELVK